MEEVEEEAEEVVVVVVVVVVVGMEVVVVVDEMKKVEVTSQILPRGKGTGNVLTQTVVISILLADNSAIVVEQQKVEVAMDQRVVTCMVAGLP